MDADTFKQALLNMPVITPDVFLRETPTMILSPHPDDESLGTGGLIAAGAASCPIDVVFVTDGAGSHPRSQLYPAPRLTALRKQEAARATEILDIP